MVDSVGIGQEESKDHGKVKTYIWKIRGLAEIRLLWRKKVESKIKKVSLHSGGSFRNAKGFDYYPIGEE